MDNANGIKLQLGSSVTIEMARSLIQIASFDCGLYSIAIGVALDTEGASREYDREKMRPHFAECFENFILFHFFEP